MNVLTAQHDSTTVPLDDRPLPKLLARAAWAGLGVFTVTVVIGGTLNSGYSHRSDAMSSLAAHDASAPMVMSIGFAGLALARLSAGAALRTALRGKAAVAGSALCCLPALRPSSSAPPGSTARR